MVEIEFTAYLKGDDFFEKDIEINTGIKFHSVKEYKKKNLPIRTYTKVVSIIPEENNIYGDDYNILLKNFSDLFEDKVEIIKKYGCESIVLLLSVKYVDQCNLSIDKSTVESIGKYFDEFNITCYEVEEL